jgi:hypothetical protein
MAQELINVGAAPNDGQGDPIREAFTKCNDNFTELFGGLGSSNAISNGNSVVQISTANGNISMSVSGTANVAVVTTTGITVSNTLTAANIDAVNLVINNISSDDSTFITIEDGVIVNGVISVAGNITGANIDAVNLVINNISSDDSTFITIEDGVIVNGVISVAGNITGANITALGNAFVTGVLSANLLLAASGNIGVPVGVATFNLANNVATTINFGGNASNIFMANVNSTTHVAGNLTAGGTVSATGNITANNFVGAGATTTLSSATNLDLRANTAVRVTGGATFRLPSLDASQIANIVAANGDMIYNTTVNKIQGYEAGAWGNLI